MKATLSFNLPEEQEEFNNATNGVLWRTILIEYDNKMRDYLKYDQNDELEIEMPFINRWRKKLHQIASDHGMEIG